MMEIFTWFSRLTLFVIGQKLFLERYLRITIGRTAASFIINFVYYNAPERRFFFLMNNDFPKYSSLKLYDLEQRHSMTKYFQQLHFFHIKINLKIFISFYFWYII